MPFTADQIALIGKLWNEGLSPDVIATRLGSNRVDVTTQLRQMDLARPTRPQEAPTEAGPHPAQPVEP